MYNNNYIIILYNNSVVKSDLIMVEAWWTPGCGGEANSIIYYVLFVVNFM